jgi:hypothetical protein
LELDEERLKRILSKPPDSPLWTRNPWTDKKHESLDWKWWLPEFFPKLQRQRKREGGSWKYSSIKIPKFGLFRHREIDDGAMMHGSTLRRIHELKDYKPRNLSKGFQEMVRGLQDIPLELDYRRDEQREQGPRAKAKGA